MNDYCTTVSLDDAFDCYEVSKRNVSKDPLYYYDLEKNEFVKIKGAIKNSGIVFLNSYNLCSKLIDEYLSHPLMQEYKDSFDRVLKNTKNKIVSFLWFFEHIDGCQDFQKFEILKVEKELKKWCKSNGLEYLDPVVYRIN